MFKKIFKLFAIVLVVLFGVLFYNTITLNSAIIPHKTVEIPANKDSSAIHLSQAIQIKTVSFGDTLPIDTTEFLKFRKFLETSYPLVHSKLSRQVFNEFSYVYKWVGKDTTLAPYVLMGHTDVVPVEAASESKWSVPSFSGAIKNDTIWGRGAVDDKVAVIAIYALATMKKCLVSVALKFILPGLQTTILSQHLYLMKVVKLISNILNV